MVFPALLQRYVEEGAEVFGAPADYFGLAMIAAAGTAAGGAVEVELRRSWHEGPRIYAALVGRPGSAKTPVVRHVFRPIYRIAGTLDEDARAALTEHERELAVFDADLRDWKKERGGESPVHSPLHMEPNVLRRRRAWFHSLRTSMPRRRNRT